MGLCSGTAVSGSWVPERMCQGFERSFKEFWKGLGFIGFRSGLHIWVKFFIIIGLCRLLYPMFRA